MIKCGQNRNVNFTQNGEPEHILSPFCEKELRITAAMNIPTSLTSRAYQNEGKICIPTSIAFPARFLIIESDGTFKLLNVVTNVAYFLQESLVCEICFHSNVLRLLRMSECSISICSAEPLRAMQAYNCFSSSSCR